MVLPTDMNQNVIMFTNQPGQFEPGFIPLGAQFLRLYTKITNHKLILTGLGVESQQSGLTKHTLHEYVCYWTTDL